MGKHYIYEIFGRKIGATNDVERRMKEQKVKEGEYRIIEEHTNAKICSIREIELQKEFNYPVDRTQYWKTIKMQKKTITKEARKKAVVNTDYKARTANINYKASRAKINWIAKAEKCKKPVNQYDLKDNFIKQWEGATDAAKSIGNKSPGNISACCRGIIKKHKNYIWKYA
jgi:hypothetical protein